jgi:hypothetical protein
MNNWRIYNVARTEAQLLDEATQIVSYSFEDNLNDAWSFRQHMFGGQAPVFGAGRNAAAGKAVVLDGTANSFVQTKRQIWRPGSENNVPYTIAMWIRPTAAAGVVLHLADTIGGGGYCYSVARLDTATKKMLFTHFNGTGQTLTSTNAIAENAWTHVAFTFSPAGGTKLYINGVEDVKNAAINSWTGSGGTAPKSYILGSARGGTGCLGANATNFNGSVDDFKIYARELAPADIQKLAQ